MHATSVPQLIRETNRFRQVVTILAKYGLSQWLRNVPVPWIKKLLRDTDGHEIANLSFNESVHAAINELGTTFVKLGQILSTRSDLIGVDLANQLSELRANVPVEAVESVIATVESELGAPVDELFADFQREPLAAASIAQVHRATMFDGTEVVVKIQRCDIEKQIATDLEILNRIAELAEKHSRALRHYQPVSTAAKFQTILLRELDFQREQQNMNEFIRNFQGDMRVKFARPVEQLSTRKVLTMEFLSGINPSAKGELRSQGIDLSSLASDGAGVFLDMIFRDGFYHADPHPGNIVVMSDGQIGLLDCGMVGRVENGLRDQIENMLLALARGNANQLARSVVVLGSVPAGFDEVLLEADIEDFVAEYANRPLAEVNLSQALREMVELIRRHHVTLPPSITLLLKVLIMLEGTSKSLDPEFSLAELIAPYRIKALRRRYSPRSLRRHLEQQIRDWHELSKVFPGDLADILERVKSGKFDVHLDHRRLDSIINRLVSGVLTAALFMGSSALWSQQVPPLILGTSVPGFLGCGVAVLLGLRIFQSIRRSSRLDER